MIGDTIENAKGFLDVNIIIELYLKTENCTSVSSSNLAIIQPKRTMFTNSIRESPCDTPDVRCSTGT